MAGCVPVGLSLILSGHTTIKEEEVITADQLVCHLIGDYMLQSSWQTSTKRIRWEAALFHAVCYSLPFVFLGPSKLGFAFIVLTHAAIDHFGLARYICWAKEWLGFSKPKPWKECTATGYDPNLPPWLSVWLMIIVDNTLHVLCNGIAFKFL